MKLSRRRFFGASAGAAVAGPSVLKEAATQGGALAGRTQILRGQYVGENAAKTPVADPEFMKRRRADLERIARGDFDEWELANMGQGINPDALLASNIDALRSPSHSAKLRFMRDATVARRKAERMAEAKRSLAELAKNWLGIK